MKYVATILMSLMLTTTVIAETPAEREAQRKRIEAAQKILQQGKKTDAATLKAENAKLRAEVARLKVEIAKLKRRLGIKAIPTIKPTGKEITSLAGLINRLPSTLQPKKDKPFNTIYQRRFEAAVKTLNGKMVIMKLKVRDDAYKAQWAKNQYAMACNILKEKVGKFNHTAVIFCMFPFKVEDQLAEISIGDQITAKGRISDLSIKIIDGVIAYHFKIEECTIVKP